MFRFRFIDCGLCESQTPLSEDVVPRPQDPYGIAKYAVEMDLAAANHLFDLPYIIFRPHNVYGERQNIAGKYRNVVGIFMNQVTSGRPMTIFGDGQQTRAFSYIDDVAPIIARAPLVEAAYGRVFNIGADQPCTVLELAREVASAFEVEPRIQHLPPRKRRSTPSHLTEGCVACLIPLRSFPCPREFAVWRPGSSNTAR